MFEVTSRELAEGRSFLRRVQGVTSWSTHTAGGCLSRPAALQLVLLQTGRRCQAFPIGPAALDLPGAWEGRRPPDEAQGREALSAGTLL